MDSGDNFNRDSGQVVALQIEEASFSAVSQTLEEIGYEELASLAVSNFYVKPFVTRDPVDDGVTSISFNIQVVVKRLDA